jgi:hypothetical protein
LVPHGTFSSDKADDYVDAEVVDVIEDVVVSPEGIEPARPRPQADGRVTEFFRGETD